MTACQRCGLDIFPRVSTVSGATCLACWVPPAGSCQTVTPTAHEKAEWRRVATAAYHLGLNSIGHRFSAAGALPTDATMSLGNFDAIQAEYRAWLLDGFAPQAVRS